MTSWQRSGFNLVPKDVALDFGDTDGKSAPDGLSKSPALMTAGVNQMQPLQSMPTYRVGQGIDTNITSQEKKTTGNY